jgi:Pyruvate kinase, barrel domain
MQGSAPHLIVHWFLSYTIHLHIGLDAGELGLSLGPEKVALAQSYAGTKINVRGKVSLHQRLLACMDVRRACGVALAEIFSEAVRHVQASIVSRQMLASMISNPRPTRAEMTDVAARSRSLQVATCMRRTWCTSTALC